MDKETFAKYLTDRYQDQISFYDKSAIKNQKKYRRMRGTVIVFATLTPFLIELPLEGLWEHLATVTSAVVAILTVSLKTFNYQENWHSYRTTCETLIKEQHFYEAGIGEYRTIKDKEALFVERVESMIARENTVWISTQKTQDSPDNKGSGDENKR